MRIDPTQLTYSRHARQRMTQRHISRAQVASTIARPRKIYGDCRFPGKILRRYHGHQGLVVVLDADGPAGTVITTYQHRSQDPS